MRERKDEANEMLSDSPSWAYLSRRWRYTSNLIFRIASTKHWMNACCSILLHHALAQENDENALVAIRKSRLGRDCIYSHSYSDSCGAMCHMLIIRMTWRNNDHRHNRVFWQCNQSLTRTHSFFLQHFLPWMLGPQCNFIHITNDSFFLQHFLPCILGPQCNFIHITNGESTIIYNFVKSDSGIERMILLGWMPPQADDYGRWRETFK